MLLGSSPSFSTPDSSPVLPISLSTTSCLWTALGTSLRKSSADGRTWIDMGGRSIISYFITLLTHTNHYTTLIADTLYSLPSFNLTIDTTVTTTGYDQVSALSHTIVAYLALTCKDWLASHSGCALTRSGRYNTLWLRLDTWCDVTKGQEKE